ncbi:hypothetical protein VF21_00837 [Pseudogymnoascus sp. 05NY08]|nr:hypothetical protein VF21_00837 [Pseudogymnoascus sp. 05NY08]
MPPPWTSQNLINDFWSQHLSPNTPPVKASAVLPKDFYATKVSKRPPSSSLPSVSVRASYDAAVAACTKKVAHIVRECQAMNLKYTDPYFDLDDKEDCMYPLSMPERKLAEDVRPNRGLNLYEESGGGERKGHLLLFGNAPEGGARKAPLPPSVKRVGDIFDNPQFYVDGASAKDVRQGGSGDCWFMSALMALCNSTGADSLLEKVCVARDQEVGVYGFVVFRDGEWESVIIDDKLYLRKPDYDDLAERVRKDWEAAKVRDDDAEDWRREFQTNSGALYFAQSTHEDETWVPLLEKAYAKAHGDYGAIHGGNVGEAMEDLTGGISVMISTRDILSKERLWQDLLKVNTEYLFGCASPVWDDPDDDGGKDGIQANHAYSILRAVQYKNERLLLIKNPWGRKEWKGPWSDGAKEWTHESIRDLGHTFGDDGIFWIRYQDLLRKYDEIYRTRLFADEWRVAQQWVNVDVPWAGDYLDTRFEVTLEKGAQTVIILSQLDERYFRGLVGQYVFLMSFRVHKKGEEDYLMRTHGEFYRQRSVSAELFLEAGTYEIRMKVAASRNDKAHKVEDIVKGNWLDRREKLLQVGLSYDIAHAKGQPEYDSSSSEDEDEKETPKSQPEPSKPQPEPKVDGKPTVEEEVDTAPDTHHQPHDTTSQDEATASGEDDWEDDNDPSSSSAPTLRRRPTDLDNRPRDFRPRPRDYPPPPPRRQRTFSPGPPRRRGTYSPGPRRAISPGPRRYPPGPPRGFPLPPRGYPGPPPPRNYPPGPPRGFPGPPGPLPPIGGGHPPPFQRRGSLDNNSLPPSPHRSVAGSFDERREMDFGRDMEVDGASLYYDTAVNPRAWGAAVVVGVRVYCRDVDPGVRVVRGDGKEEEGGVKGDVDDPAVDAVGGEKVGGGGGSRGLTPRGEGKEE